MRTTGLGVIKWPLAVLGDKLDMVEGMATNYTAANDFAYTGRPHTMNKFSTDI